jgi:uncharacterized repeat protein (TIGR03803 family)
MKNFTFSCLRLLRRGAIASVLGAVALASLVTLFTLASSTSRAQTESVLYSFCSLPNCADGSFPAANLILDEQGNLYGATQEGGITCAVCFGVIFEVTPSGAENVIWNLPVTVAEPNGGLVRDASGNFYGTTVEGGYELPPCKQVAGCGVIFETSPSGMARLLYAFSDGDGRGPNGSLIFDTQSNLFGTTNKGGQYKTGTLFKLESNGTFSDLHIFGAYKGDGKLPTAGVVMDTQGNLYGTTSAGGHSGDSGPGVGKKAIACFRGCGTVFEFTTAGVETVLYTFEGWKKHDGAEPFAGLIRDTSGNLYGTTNMGGAYGYGTIFRVTPAGKETVLYSFAGMPDGANPTGSLVMDAQGNLYGTTFVGGTYGDGTVFQVTASGTEMVLYNFRGGVDGENPNDGLVLDAHGNLFGTTYVGGANKSGTVFEVTAPSR